jgi:hypothetical protein
MFVMAREIAGMVAEIKVSVAASTTEDECMSPTFAVTARLDRAIQ